MNYYFSRVQLLDRPLDMALLTTLSRHGEAYRDHALIWRLFPEDDVTRDFVFRREVDERGRTFYYVVSAREPRAEPGLFVVQSKPYRPQLNDGDWVAFDLRANPTVTRRVVPGGPSRRHDVLMEAKRGGVDLPESERADAIHTASIAWLAERATTWGLRLRAESVLAHAYTQHQLRHKQRSIAFSSLDYQGVAQVTDPGLLQEKLFGGVGHARAFGCGLLLLKRMG